MKLITVVLISLFLFGIHANLSAQTSADTARGMAIGGELQAAMKSGDFPKAAALSKELIALGMKTSDMYFTAGTTFGLAGDKPGAIAYFDTAASKGWNKLGNWQQITGMIGIAGDPAIMKSTEIVKRNAEKNPEAKAKDVNMELHKIYLADQKDRTDLMGSGDVQHISLETALKLYRADSVRRIQVYALLKDNKLSTGRDFSEAALILQHGNDTSDYRNAHELALASVKLGNKDGKWLAAATLDRYLVAQKKPQKYGTQSFTNEKTGKRELYPVDPSVTDKERAEWDCPPLKNALKAVEKVYDKK
ncbi:MAG: hypothetical protein ACHQM6_06795 [Candidatus Kapaibacterium sp.]